MGKRKDQEERDPGTERQGIGASFVDIDSTKKGKMDAEEVAVIQEKSSKSAGSEVGGADDLGA